MASRNENWKLIVTKDLFMHIDATSCIAETVISILSTQKGKSKPESFILKIETIVVCILKPH